MTNKNTINNSQYPTHNSLSLLTKSAFTLAETLIVMGIIGVVAALTLPNLNSSTGDKEKVAKLKKIYSNLNDAYGRAQAVYGPIAEWTQSITDSNDKADKIAIRVLEFLKISKDCGNGGDNCPDLPDGQYYINGTLMLEQGICTDLPAYCVILSDGTLLSLYEGGIEVDIDGPNSGKSVWGKDLFAFTVNSTTGEIFPSGYDLKDTELKPYCFNNGSACAAWVLTNGNMDYLKATNGKCANGTELSWTNITCK